VRGEESLTCCGHKSVVRLQDYQTVIRSATSSGWSTRLISNSEAGEEGEPYQALSCGGDRQ